MKVYRLEEKHCKPMSEIIGEMRIGKNMKVMDICRELGISKRTYLRYAPFEIKGAKRIQTNEDIQARLVWAEHARKVWQSMPRKEKKIDPEKGIFSWRKTNRKFFQKSH